MTTSGSCHPTHIISTETATASGVKVRPHSSATAGVIAGHLASARGADRHYCSRRQPFLRGQAPVFALPIMRKLSSPLTPTEAQAIGRDNQRRANIGENRNPQADEPEHCQHEREKLDQEREGHVLLDHVTCAP